LRRRADGELSTPLCERLGIRLPVIQAPMAGGPTTPALVAASSAAGALGSFGHAYTQPEEMKKQAATVRSSTERPFGINLFVFAAARRRSTWCTRARRSPPRARGTPKWGFLRPRPRAHRMRPTWKHN
jgi:nitronate monooxygenase